MLGALRQLCFDPELRISAPREEQALPTSDLLAAFERASAGAAEPAPGPSEAREGLGGLVAEVASWSWEIAREVEGLGADAPPFLRRGVEGLDGALQHHEVEIQDFSGRDFDVRDNWDRVVSAPTEKRRPYIARMMVPRIFFRGALLRAGVPVVEDREDEP